MVSNHNRLRGEKIGIDKGKYRQMLRDDPLTMVLGGIRDREKTMESGIGWRSLDKLENRDIKH